MLLKMLVHYTAPLTRLHSSLTCLLSASLLLFSDIFGILHEVALLQLLQKKKKISSDVEMLQFSAWMPSPHRSQNVVDCGTQSSLPVPNLMRQRLY